jgi:membrane-associated phospholipid phosphatase
MSGAGGAGVTEVRDDPVTGRRTSASWVAVGWCSAGFVALAACVALGLADALDRAVLAFARPEDVWGPGQARWGGVVDALRPPVAATALAALAVAVCLARRSLRPALMAVAAGTVATAATLIVKFALARPDPHLTGTGHGGSFPSGHTVAVVVSVGLAVRLLRPRARGWASAASLVAGAVMGVGLVVIGAHWATDVLGGMLLGLAVVSAAPVGERRTAGDPPSRDRVTGRRVS